jgi:hypothetical protein
MINQIDAASVQKLNQRINAGLQAERLQAIENAENRVRMLYRYNRELALDINYHQRAIRAIRLKMEENDLLIKTNHKIIENAK